MTRKLKEVNLRDTNNLILFNIRNIRMQRGLSQYRVAKEAGLTKARLSLCERGIHAPSTLTIQKLVKALNISRGELEQNLTINYDILY